MTYLDAAYTILKAAGRPLHYEEITERALTQKLIAPAPIPGTGLWVEANQSAKSAAQVIGRLLAALGHRPADFQVVT